MDDTRGPHHAEQGAFPKSREPQALDLRLVPPAISAWVAAALGLELPTGSTTLLVVATWLGVLALAVPALRTRRALTVTATLAMLAAAAGGTSAALHSAAARSGPLPLLAEREALVEVEVTVTGDPRMARPKPGAWTRPLLITATADLLTTAEEGSTEIRTPTLLIVSQPDEAWQRLLPTTRLKLTARAAPPTGSGADIAAVLFVRGAAPPQTIGDPTTVQRLAGALRERLRMAVAGLPDDPKGLLPALIVGDASQVPDDLDEAVRATDLTHMIVVSGAHLSLLLAVVIGTPTTASRAERGGIVARLGLPLRATAVIGGAVVIGFVILCRPGPSVLRAAVCGAIALLAVATGRRRSLLPALAAAALLLILYDPTHAQSFGFLLSVLATAALLIIAPKWSLALQRRGAPPRLAEGLAVALAAQLVCAPVVAVFSARVSLVAVPANLLAELAFAPVLVLGWAAMMAAPVALPLAQALAWLASWPARWIATVARTGASLPGAEFRWPDGWWGAALLTVLSVALIVLVRRLRHRPWTAAICALLLLLAALRPQPLEQWLTGWPPQGWRVVACDVGQGDATVLAAGPGRAVVVDAGPDPRAMDDCLRALGVRHIPVVVLSHFHADHVAGLPGVLDGRSVGVIHTTATRQPESQVREVESTAAKFGVPVQAATAGDQGAVGHDLAWEVLWPPPHETMANANDASVTLLVRTAGLTVLLPGDLEPAAQQRLIAAHPALPTVDVLKVPHHGSAYQEDDLLRLLRPRWAIVSAGADNSYGHPDPRTLATLEQAGATVLRTDLHGSLAITTDGAATISTR
ncbi:ComEC/Rec2 family competence protein [Streptomyces lonarensis]|uniref:MBL fold metallo-hydrolase n=1 Tax=Streptomyces lonarensis TaxID=700599 RepID=A0A7X6CYB9_9ACTN|nr:ComEC/Rec2 family competence protein [Streptomyces lonarensis]NJQ04824.1 MBL fold metallo-hydrolase [Streptomyces lonarensis]